MSWEDRWMRFMHILGMVGAAAVALFILTFGFNVTGCMLSAVQSEAAANRSTREAANACTNRAMVWDAWAHQCKDPVRDQR